jgi:RNA polymerase sigma factor (sigma-70 family)
MTSSPFERIVRYLQRTTNRSYVDGTDGELLERFCAQRDAVAFETLMRRHGALVWGVCRRRLRDEQDAEDAFQATFLVLLRKAGTLERRPSVGSWLYGVAFRVSGNVIKARAVDARRRDARSPVENMPQPSADEPADWQELRPLLDQELHQLPEKYRVPLVLCCLEGKTNEQAAGELGWPIGSMSRRLARGRELLRQRLVRRGVTLSVGALATLLTQHGVTAAPPALVSVTFRIAQTLILDGQATTAGIASASVATLTEGVLHSMYLSKLKLFVSLLAGFVLMIGTGLLAHEALADKPPTAQNADPAKPPAPEQVARTTKDSLTPQSFSQFHQLIQPEPGEYRWDEVSWLTSIWHARKKATAENKPIFIFGTQGAGFNDPLGNC